jgi:hypothetical protein
MMEKNIAPVPGLPAVRGGLRDLEMSELIQHQLELERFMFRQHAQIMGVDRSDFAALTGQRPSLLSVQREPIYEEAVRAAAGGAGAGAQSSSDGSDVEILDDSDSEMVFMPALVPNPRFNQPQVARRTGAKAPAKEADKAKDATQNATEKDKKTGEEEEELPPTFRWVHIDIV